MALRFIPAGAKVFRKARTKDSREVLRRLQSYLDSNCGKFAVILCSFWKDQQDAVTYQELRQAVADGTITTEMLQLWMQDYSLLVAGQLAGMWADAVAAGVKGQPLLDGTGFKLDMQEPGIMGWISQRGAEFVTASTQEQKEAVAALLSKKMRDGHTVDELARLIRPCIGLTAGDAKAASKLYDSIVEDMKKEHPRMKPESIKRKALDAAQKYAERKHRYRAFTIAQTECAFAYNRGADEGVRQAQAQDLLGPVKKRWCTSGDDAVCTLCNSLDGTELDMDENFNIRGKILFKGQHLLPPAHPRCACGIQYIETSPPVLADVPVMDITVTQNSSFREYSDEEINNIAGQTETIISRYVSTPSKWSGNMVITDSGVDDGTGNIVHYGKLWGCDIVTKHETAPAIIMHEQLHARSASYYGKSVYSQFQCIEEASVQFMAMEICMAEGIGVINSVYDENVDILRKIRGYLDRFGTDLDFAKALIAVPLPGRMDWISEELYATLRENTEVTVEDYMELADMLNSLY